jgi:hypothetical protein
MPQAAMLMLEQMTIIAQKSHNTTFLQFLRNAGISTITQ